MEGIIKTALANVYRLATESAEMLTQVIFSTVVQIIDEKKGWYSIQIPVQKNYRGWIRKNNISLMEPPVHFCSKTIVWKHGAALKKEPQMGSNTILHLPLNTRLWVLERRGNWIAVWRPEGEKAWLNTLEQREEKTFPFKVKNPAAKILHLAASLKGVPYLWGGITPEGFDCSGFVYTLFALHGFALHRDADLQYAYDGIPVNLEEIGPGDLLFFHEGTIGKPTHVGIYAGRQSFINASSKGGGVISYSLAEDNWQLKVSGVKRIF